jgi:aspartate ammonia-lyase
MAGMPEPTDAWRGYGQTARSVETHSFSGARLCDYPVLVESLLLVKRAAAMANGITGRITQELAERIVGQCDHLLDSDGARHFAVDVFQGGGGIAINTNFNEAIATLDDGSPRFAMEPREHVNASQSTADVVATAARITLVRLHVDWNQVLMDVESAFADLESRLQNTPSVARTCLQDAMPAPLGVLFSGYRSAISRRRMSLAGAVDRLRAVNLGGTVIGSGEGASAEYRRQVYLELNQWLPFTVYPRENLYDAAQNSDDLGHVAAEISLLADVLIKIGKDLRLLAAGPSGFHEIRLPKVIESSSFFADKNNPTIVETLLNCCFLVVGKCRTIQAALEHGELHLNVFDPTAAVCIYEAMEMMTNALINFHRHCLLGIEATKESTASP